MRRLSLLLPLVLAVGCAATAAESRPDPPEGGTRVDPKSPQGAIGGQIKYPQGVAPAMRVCALSAAAQQCIDSPAGRTLYRIGNLPAGEYRVVARLDSSEYPIAGHVQAVQCITAPCLDQPVTIALADGKEVASADLNGFYAERGDFPTLP